MGNDDVVRAAGGVVARRVDGQPPQVALVHRPRYDDWTLPKGKVMPGEDDRAAALREVEEETGLACRLGRPLGRVAYRDRRGRPKVVRYWLMEPIEPTSGADFAPNDEVDELRWLPIPEALDTLTYRHDREMLEGIDQEAIPADPR